MSDHKVQDSSEAYETYHLGDLKLQCGEVLPGAWVAYRTFGERDAPGGAVLYPSWYSGAISDNVWLVGPSKTLSPTKYFVIIPALIGNGQSISPSNTSFDHPFPAITFYDNVLAQHSLLTNHLGITHLRAVLGWSMGAGQTYQWATQYPDFMDLIVPFCGSAKTSLHNQVFLEGVKSALLAGKTTSSAGVCICQNPGEGKRVWTEEEKVVGLKALGRVYAGWGFSQAFYREKEFERVYGHKSLEDFMVDFWEGWALSKDPENMLTMLYTWQKGDCSFQPPYHGDFAAAMKGIKAKALVLPGQTDLYFPPEDSHNEVDNMSPGTGKCIPFPSIWGHWAGGPPGNVEDMNWLDERLEEFFKDGDLDDVKEK